MTKETALKMALKALEANYQLINGTDTNGGLIYCIDGYYSDCFDEDPVNEQTEEAITAIKQALAQHDSVQAKPEPEQEPVAQYIGEAYEGSLVQLYDDVKKGTNFYTTPPQRTWVKLTDEEIDSYFEDHGWSPSEYYYSVIKDIETKLKHKNGFAEEKNT